MSRGRARMRIAQVRSRWHKLREAILSRGWWWACTQFTLKVLQGNFQKVFVVITFLIKKRAFLLVKIFLFCQSSFIHFLFISLSLSLHSLSRRNARETNLLLVPLYANPIAKEKLFYHANVEISISTMATCTTFTKHTLGNFSNSKNRYTYQTNTTDSFFCFLF